MTLIKQMRNDLVKVTKIVDLQLENHFGDVKEDSLVTLVSCMVGYFQRGLGEPMRMVEEWNVMMKAREEHQVKSI